MGWAISGRISTDPIEGGIEISDADYALALAGILDGKEIVVANGVLSILAPVQPQPSPAERRAACLSEIRSELAVRYDAVLSPARRQLAQIDAVRISRKPVEERSHAESARLADIERDQTFFEELERHAAILAVEVEDLPDEELAGWSPHSWPSVET